MGKKKRLNEDLEKGQIFQVALNSISFIASNAVPGGGPNTNTTVTEIELKKPVNFDLICEFGRNGLDKYLYCHASEEPQPLAIRLTLEDGRKAYLDYRSGFETMDSAKIEIGKAIGGMYRLMLASSLEDEMKATDFQLTRERFQNLEHLSEKSDAELDQMAEEQTERSKRRLVIYTWCMENCIGFNEH